MKKVLKPALFTLSGMVLTLVGSYFYVQAQSDTITASVTIPATLTLSDDGVNFSIANLTPETIDSSQATTLTLSSNSPDGFRIEMDLDDLDGSPGQLCEDDALGACTLKIFDADGLASYISFTSNAGSGALNTLTGASFADTEVKLGAAGPHPAFVATQATNADTLDIDYNAFADSTVVPASYEGRMTFTIISQ